MSSVLNGALVVIALQASWLAFTDVRQRRIANGQVGIMMVLTWVIAIATSQGQAAVLSFALASTIGIGLYLIQFWAGGDAKLLMALAPLLTIDELLSALFWTLLFGGGLALVYLIKYRVIHRSKDDPGLPYGLAIVLGVGFQLLASTPNT